MKILVQISRVLVGLLFIFSGVIKLNDPSGFSIKLNEYFDVFAADVSTQQDSLTVSLMDGPKVLGSKTFILYSFDKERTLEFENEYEAQRDTAGKIIRYDANMELSLGTETVADLDYAAMDSIERKMVAVKVTIAGNSAFQKTFMASPAKMLNETQIVNVQQYVKPEGWLNGFFKGMKSFSLWLSIFVCSLEVILGFALIVGWKSRLTSWLLLLLIIFFTFLTFYAANYNKVTDCGCFGDFIKLKPWQSFNKDLVLLVLILIIFLGARYIKPWFSKKFGWKFMAMTSLITVAFGVLCYLYLPLWDFLPYKKGNDIKKIMTDVPAGMRATDSVEIRFVMQKGNDSAEVTSKQYADYTAKGYTYKRRIDKIIIEGYKNPIHDFAINDMTSGRDLKDSLLSHDGFQLVFISPFLDKVYEGCMPETKEIYAWTAEKNIPFFAVTASSKEPASEFTKKHKLGFNFMAGDQKFLMTMARYNPTMYLMNGPVVVKKWSGRNLPSVKSLEKHISK